MPHAPHTFIRIQHEDFDLSTEVAALRATDAAAGAVCSFVGTVRQATLGDNAALHALELEHYPGMAEKALHAMVDAARQRFDILGVRIIHRVGRLALQEQIVLVAVASAHRHEAFAACEFLMDYLKTEAPFWKKEHATNATRWVEARESDDAARDRWQRP